MRRGPDLDEPVDLLDDEWTSATPVTTTRTRRRWPEALLVAAALAVVIGIGATGDDDGDDATDMPRTTSTTVRRSTSTTRPRPTTTSTTWPTAVAGSGSLLGGAPSGSSLVVSEEGTLAVLDLDTGDLCRTDANGTGPWWVQMPTQHALGTDAEASDDQGRSVLIGGDCAIRPSNRVTGDGWVVARTGESYWTMEDGPTQVLTERSDAGEVLRRFPAPAYNGAVTDGQWLVLSMAGELVAIEVRGDRQIGLGSGWPLATGGGRLLAIRCESLECALTSIDIESRRARRLDLPLPTQWEPAALSPDGRWLAYTTARGEWSPATQYQVEPVVADLVSMTTIEARGGPCAFTADSRWLVCTRPSVIEAISLDDGRIVDMSDLFDRPTNGFAVIRNG